MTSVKMPFARNKNGKLVHISEVESGKKYNCICPDCGFPLIASKGIQNQHHFKHIAINKCEGESAVHKAAKQIIIERKQIMLPRYIVSVSRKNSRGIKHTEEKVVVEEGKTIDFDSVDEEKELHDIRADILAKKGNSSLVIEIFYSHKVDDQKRKKIVDANLSAIEINLSALTQEDLENWEAFWVYLNRPQHIQWLHNVKADSYYRELQKVLEKRIQEQEAKYKQEAEIEKQQLTKQVPALSLSDLRRSQSKQHSEPNSRLLLLTQLAPYSCSIALRNA